MSIFFDFNIGANRRRFRRAVDGDKADIEAIIDRKYTEPLFGEVNVASLIELSTLSICMINKKNEVIGFMALCDHPNVPGVDPADWEIWIRNMFQKYYLARNTLFIHFMYCIDTVTDIFLEAALKSIFTNDVYIWQMVMVVPPKCPEDSISRYLTRQTQSINKYLPKRPDSCDNGMYLHTALRKDYCTQFKIRHAVEEDNDDIVEILGKNCPRLQELYGDFYISEIIGRHPEMNRKIIVAECHDQVVGVMCLNSDVNYEMLQDTYELANYYGLQKATPYEKELRKRNNDVLKIFGEPIMHGKWGPFTTLKKERILGKNLRKNKRRMPSTQSNTKASKVIFDPDEIQNHSHSMDCHISEEIPDSSITNRYFANQSFIDLSLEDESFDYEIVNIEKNLLTIPDELSYEFLLPTVKKQQTRANEKERKSCSKRRTSVLKIQKSNENKKMYSGSPNAFIIELFGLKEGIDETHAFELLEGAFEVMHELDYCLIRLPCEQKSFNLLQHFCFVPTKDNVSSKYALYVAHRCSVLSKLRVRKAEVIDIPQIANFLQNLECRDVVWTVENSVLQKNEFKCFVFMSSLTLIGIGILEPPEEVNFLETHFNMDTYQITKHHKKENPSGGIAMLKSVLIYPVFEPHFRFFARDMMRLSGSTTLMFLTAYRNKWHTHKANSMVGTMVPLLPRKSETHSSSELNGVPRISDTIMPFSAWLVSKKITSIQKVNIDTRILIVGASRTAMAFLNTLLFSDSSTYLFFTNVTLVSTHGLPYSRHTNTHADMMFNYYKTNSNKYLKSVPYTYYVNVIKGQMVDINKREKYIQLSNGSKCYYDLLFLLFGKQYQHPYYLEDIIGVDKFCSENNTYKRLDVTRIETPKVNCKNIPRNVFIINSVADANKALSFISSINWLEGDDKIIVYGCTHNAHCCLATLIEMKIPGESIIFVEPFPDEDPKKTRVPLFCNVYVDKTVQEFLKKLSINVYRSSYFHSWTLDSDDLVTHVDFHSHSKMIKLQCSAFFYYGKQDVNEQAFIALNKSGIVYDGGILIDHQFKTKDPSIYAAGPVTRYHRRYYADGKRQKYYDAYEIGTKLGTQIRNQLDPLAPEKQRRDNKVRRTTKTVSFDNSFMTGDGTGDSESTKRESQQIDTQNGLQTPNFKSPLIIHCTLPGSLKYLDVRSPGKKLPHYYVQSLDYNGFVLETFKGGYFRLHLTKDFKVDGITCLATETYSLENFKNLYGLPSTVLNNVYLRYMTKRLDNFYEFFSSPWASFLYHDQRDELFAMVKELLPKGHRHGDTLEEALLKIAEEMTNPSLNTLLQMRSRFENSLHFEAIIDYVIEWVTENESTTPMYLNPYQQSKLSYDPNVDNVFRKRKRSIIKMLSKII